LCSRDSVGNLLFENRIKNEIAQITAICMIEHFKSFLPEQEATSGFFAK